MSLCVCMCVCCCTRIKKVILWNQVKKKKEEYKMLNIRNFLFLNYNYILLSFGQSVLPNAFSFKKKCMEKRRREHTYTYTYALREFLVLVFGSYRFYWSVEFVNWKLIFMIKRHLRNFHLFIYIFYFSSEWQQKDNDFNIDTEYRSIVLFFSLHIFFIHYLINAEECS